MTQKRDKTRTRSGLRNALTLSALAFGVSLFFSGLAQQSLETVNIWSGVFILAIILVVAVFFDILAVAVAAAEEAPFHAMASHRVPGGKEAVYLVRHAARVNSLCGDVIGDICGTVSGAIAAPLIVEMSVRVPAVPLVVWSMLIIGLIAAFTIGGKAATKGLALRHANTIIGAVGKAWYWAKRVLPRSRRAPGRL